MPAESHEKAQVPCEYMWKYVKINIYTPFLVYCCTIVRDSNCFNTQQTVSRKLFLGSEIRVESVMPLQELEFSSAANTSVIGSILEKPRLCGMFASMAIFSKGLMQKSLAASRKSEATSFRFHYWIVAFHGALKRIWTKVL